MQKTISKNILTLGFIGNGKSANRYHIPYILQRKDKFRIKSIYARSILNPKWEPVDGVIYSESVDTILDDSEIDVVVITTPTATHYQYAKMALNAGKHCIVEKPFTVKKWEAEELFRLANQKDLVLQGYQNRRFDSDFLTTQKVIQSGKLGELFEMEMHFDYFRPEVPESVAEYSVDTSFLYGHACHTLDQVISCFGKPDHVHYDVRQLLGRGRMNDYFDIDLYYGILKVAVKSSYYRIKDRPKFVAYGKNGMWIKETPDRQEEHLKQFYMPEHDDFGVDRICDYGTLMYYDENREYHEEKVVSEHGDYGKYYDALYNTITSNQPPLVKPEQTILLVELLEKGAVALG